MLLRTSEISALLQYAYVTLKNTVETQKRIAITSHGSGTVTNLF